MSDHLSERAHGAVAEAEAAAHRLAHHYIGTEHLLVGLARATDSTAEDALRRCGLDADTIEAQVEALLGRGQTALAVRPPLTSSAALVLERSRWEARQFGEAVAEPGHVLLALLRLPQSTAATVLAALGLTTTQLEVALGDDAVLVSPGAPVAPTPDPFGHTLQYGDGATAPVEVVRGDGPGAPPQPADRALEPLAIVVARLSREVAELRAEVERLRSLAEAQVPPPLDGA